MIPWAHALPGHPGMGANIKQLANYCAALAHPIRIMIAVKLAEGPASWSELKQYLEQRLGGKLNPNVMAFHMKRLVEYGAVEKRGDNYSLAGPEVARLIECFSTIAPEINGSRSCSLLD